MIRNKEERRAARLKTAMICKECGTENRETAKFCKNCGSILKKEEFKTVTESEKETEREDEKKGGGICPFCGAEVSDIARFCKKCGEKLRDSIDDEYEILYREKRKADCDGDSEDIRKEKEKLRDQCNDETSGSGNIYNSVHVNSGHSTITEDQLPVKYRPIGAWAYFGWTLLFSIPVAGLIVALVFALGNTENINLRNFARSMFCYLAVVAVLIILILGGAGCTAGMLL